MNTVVVVALAVVAGLLALAVLIAVVVWFVRSSAQRSRDEVTRAYPQALAGPDPVMYRGGTGDYPRVRTTGWLVLTDEAVVVRPLTGQEVSVPVREVTGTRVEKSFNTHRNGKPVLVLETPQGDVGLTVGDLAKWQAALQR